MNQHFKRKFLPRNMLKKKKRSLRRVFLASSQILGLTQMKTYFHQVYISFLCMLHTELNQNGWPNVTEPPCMALMCHVMYYSLNIQRTSQRLFWCVGSRLLLTSSEIHLFPCSLYITHPLCASMNIPPRSGALGTSQDVRSSYLNKAFGEKGL